MWIDRVIYVISILFQAQDIGLAARVERDAGTQLFIKKLLALPMLPASQLEIVFDRLRDQATTPRLVELCEYVERTWFRKWTPADWSVFNKPVRTNNDCEGWHNRLNGRCRGHKLNMYRLIVIMHQEARLVKIQVGWYTISPASVQI